MKVEIGKRYRFELLDGEVVEGVVELHPSGTVFTKRGGVTTHYPLDDDGVCLGQGRLVVGRFAVDVHPAADGAAAKLLPVFRHDADEHRRLQQFFRGERDVTLGTST